MNYICANCKFYYKTRNGMGTFHLCTSPNVTTDIITGYVYDNVSCEWARDTLCGLNAKFYEWRGDEIKEENPETD